MTVAVLGLLCWNAVPEDARAQGAWPSKPLRFVLPYPPGGAIDILGRMLAQPLGEALGQNVVPDNRGGANGIVASDLVARAPADGYTVYLASVGQVSINPAAYRKLPYDPFRDLSPVILHSGIASLLLVHAAVPATNVKDFIVFARSRPDGLSYATPGAASTNHLSTELFASMTGLKLTHVPYKGSGPALIDLIGGQVHMMFDQITSSLPHVKSGKLKALAVTTAKRSALLPDLPAVAESGFPGFDTSSWNGVMAPAGTPRPVIDRLNRTIAAFHARPEFRERLLSVGAEPLGGTPEDFSRHGRRELERWTEILRKSGTRLD
jgi:tripartite-type tricarboxylate transporter receptor subunit TctC